jgi:hypothetical protein
VLQSKKRKVLNNFGFSSLNLFLEAKKEEEEEEDWTESAEMWDSLPKVKDEGAPVDGEDSDSDSDNEEEEEEQPKKKTPLFFKKAAGPAKRTAAKPSSAKVAPVKKQ